MPSPPRVFSLSQLRTLFLLLLGLLVPQWVPCAKATAGLSPPSPSPPQARTPVIMLSSADGTLSAYDARTGVSLFTHRDVHPAVESWTAPGVPEYIPSFDGLLYRIDPTTNEAYVIHGKFVSAATAASSTDSDSSAAPPDAPAPVPVSVRDHADAVILSEESSSVLLMDIRTGRLLSTLRYADAASGPGIPGLNEHIIAISRTSVAVRVVEVGTNRQLANATLVHNVPSFIGSHQCPAPRDPVPDAFVAYTTGLRDRLYVRSTRTGRLLWSKRVPSSIVEAHGLGGVRVVATRRDAELAAHPTDDRALPDQPGVTEHLDNLDNLEPPPLSPLPYPHPLAPASRDLYIAREGKTSYAMLAAPSEDSENLSSADEYASTNLGSRSKRKRMTRFHIANVRDPSSLGSIDRPLGLGRLPLPRHNHQSSFDPSEPHITLSTRDLGLGLLILFFVGLIGYVAGSRPRRHSSSHTSSSSSSRKKVKRRRRPGPTPEHDPDQRLNNDGDAARRNSKTSDDQELEDDHRDDDATDSGLEEEQLAATGFMAGDVAANSDNGGTANNVSDPLLEVSNGSSGSFGGGGYVSNRTSSGWMSVGCLQVSSKILGVGSHGTVVYEGKMVPGERKVAVKRLLRQFFESARKEISLLVELDEASPHVVRYFAMEEDSEFIYLALELCAGSLAERVSERGPPVPPVSYTGGPPPVHTSRALRQLIQGLADLHRVGVVHRDVKPQNVLITRSTNGIGDVKLADVGLALRLADNRSSYTAVTNAGGGVGTTGWRAPEVLNGLRQTKAVDVFAVGCVICFVLTSGDHPFGNPVFGRDSNIVAGKPSLEALETLNLPEATDIVKKMIDPVSSNRPSAEEALRHPFFWTDAMKLSFLVDISDRLYDLRHETERYTENLDRYVLARLHCSDWIVRMDMDLLLDLGRQYQNTASGLLRVIRNKRNHYSELPASLRKQLGPIPEDKHRSTEGSGKGSSQEFANTAAQDGKNFLTYFTSRVPHLLMCVYQYALENPALIDQVHFHRYGLKVERSSDQLPLHPFVRRALAERTSTEAATSRSSELGPGRPGAQNVDEGADVAGVHAAGQENSDRVGDEAIHSRPSDRRTYFRHELVAIQARMSEMHPEVRRRAMAADIYEPSAYTRYKKRLETNEFHDSDYDINEEEQEEPDEMDTEGPPPGFQRVLPRRLGPQTASGFPPRPSMSGSSPGSSRPPNFGGQRSVYGTWNGNMLSGLGTPGPAPHNRRSNANPAAPAPTISQWSGEERVVDFSSLRKQNR